MTDDVGEAARRPDAVRRPHAVGSPHWGGRGPALPPRPPNAPPAFHLLAKPTGAICNLDCAYCFFLDKEVFYPGSTFRMDDVLLEQYLRQLIE